MFQPHDVEDLVTFLKLLPEEVPVMVAGVGRGTEDVALYVGLVAGLEVPVMLLLPGLTRGIPRTRLILAGAALYGIHVALLPVLAGSPLVWLLVLPAAVGGAVTLTVPIAYLQDLHHRGAVGFEASVLTMNTRSAVLFEGIANNAILIAHGVREVHELRNPDLQIGVLLALLQDDAKNQASYLTWHEGLPKPEVAAAIRDRFLLSDERADKLSGAWGRHPLNGRMYLPAYRAGTEHVAELRRRHPPEVILPALYGARGLVDGTTINALLSS